MPHNPDACDYLVEALAYDLAGRNRELVEALRDREAYQLLAKTAIHSLAAATTENGQLRQRLIALTGELRDLRAEEQNGDIAA